MTPENFVYWLQGMMELSNTKTLDEGQVQIIKDHIALTISKKTPDRTEGAPVSPWWGIQLPKTDGYMTCSSSTDLNIPVSCGTPLTKEYCGQPYQFVKDGNAELPPYTHIGDYTIERSC